MRAFFYLTILLFLVVFSTELIAQQTQVIRGNVIDRDSKNPLTGAKIVVMNTEPLLGAISDHNGNFRIENVPIGRHTLRVTFVGYEDLILPELIVSAGKEVILTIELTEALSELGEVEIVADNEKGKPINEMAGNSVRSFTVDEAGRFSGSFNGDISRLAQSYAGVSGGSFSNELIIRGNSSKGLLWRLEGIEVPNLNHLSSNGSSGGGFSILSVNVLKNSDFYTGAFPAEYGNALSGVFDVKLRTGNDEQREYSIQLGFIGVEANTEGPFSKKSKSSYLINYRYSTTGIFEAIGLDVGGNTLPVVHDLTMKFNFPTRKAGVFTFFGIGGLSHVGVPAVKDSLQWNSRDDRFDQLMNSDMTATGLTHKLLLGNRSYLNSYVSFSASRLGDRNDSLDNAYLLQPVSKSSFIEYAFRVSTTWNCKVNAKNTLRLGGIYSMTGFDLHAENFVQNIVFLSGSGTTSMSQLYLQWKHRFTEKITLNTGIHAHYFALSDVPVAEPRLGFVWDISRRHSISISAGKHSRTEPLTFYFVEKTDAFGNLYYPNQSLKPTKALHAVLGYDFRITENLRIRIETYYQHLYDVPVEADSSSGFSVLNYSVSFLSVIDNQADVPFVNQGTGTNYGVEFTLEKFFTNHYYFLVTASLYESKYVALDGVERNTRFNNNFICNFLGGKEFPVGKTKTNFIVTDIKFIWSGGAPLTPILLDESIAQGKTVFDLDHRYEQQSADYFRIDFKIGYRKNGSKSTHHLFLDIQNLTNHKNVFAQYYSPEEQKIETIYQLGFVPVFNYRVQF